MHDSMYTMERGDEPRLTALERHITLKGWRTSLVSCHCAKRLETAGKNIPAALSETSPPLPFYSTPGLMHHKAVPDGRHLDPRSRHCSASHSQEVRLPEGVLREPCVEPYHIAHASEARGRDLEPLGRDEPGDAFAAGWGGEGAGVAGASYR